ncbi:hypothetical protein HanOQP8_Chr02g0039921 [Helianthus annuus]|nr:hypothetical protein HanOQP8_Chr02g0039921 [Helianthus annuus]
MQSIITLLTILHVTPLFTLYPPPFLLSPNQTMFSASNNLYFTRNQHPKN